MKKYVICLLGLILFLLSSTVFATNWVHVVTNGLGDIYYIDRDTVVKVDNNLIYWELTVNKDPNIWGGSKKFICKYMVKLTPSRLIRTLEQYSYDSEGHEMYRNTTPDKWYPVQASGFSDQEIDMALKYAKEGQDAGKKPDINQVS